MLHSNIQKNIFLAGEKNKMEKKKGLKWEMGKKWEDVKLLWEFKYRKSP